MRTQSKWFFLLCATMLTWSTLTAQPTSELDAKIDALILKKQQHMIRAQAYQKEAASLIDSNWNLYRDRLRKAQLNRALAKKTLREIWHLEDERLALVEEEAEFSG